MGKYERSVAPSFLRRHGVGHAADVLNKLPMRMGRVVATYGPSDPANRSKTFIEYDVLIEEGSEHASATRTLMSRCVMVSEFGGAADFTRSTPRPIDVDVNDMEDFGTGSRVLVILVNASAFAGVIIGGTPHPKAEKDDPSKGHNYVWQFNGIRQEVDKDGQLHITMKGATDAKGNLLATGNALASGTGFHLLKDGNVAWDAKKDWVQTCGGRATITATQGVHIGDATNFMMLGTVYRAAEAVKHIAEAAAWTAIAASHTAVGAAWAAIGAAPLVLSLVDPTGVMTSTALAAAPLAFAAATAATGAAAAVSTFEGGTATYLSLLNKNS